MFANDKKKKLWSIKRAKTPEIIDGCHNRRYACAIALAEKFERNTCMIGKTEWQDQKDLTLDVPVNLQNYRVYRKGKNYDIPGENLFASTNKM